MTVFLSDWRVLLRRWYVVVVGLFVTAALCLAMPKVAPVEYEATARVVLLPPKPPKSSKPTAAGYNPFLALGGLDVVTSVLAKTLSDKETTEEINLKGGAGDFTAVPDLSSGGPILLVTARGTTPAVALKTLDLALRRIPQNLAVLQTTSGVADGLLIRSKEITRDSVPAKGAKPLVRALIAVGAVGLGATVLAASLLEGLMLTRAARRRATAEDLRAWDDPAPDPDAEPDDRVHSGGIDWAGVARGVGENGRGPADAADTTCAPVGATGARRSATDRVIIRPRRIP